MPFVLAEQNSWLQNGLDPFEFEVLHTFDNLIDSVRYEILVLNSS